MPKRQTHTKLSLVSNKKPLVKWQNSLRSTLISKKEDKIRVKIIKQRINSRKNSKSLTMKCKMKILMEVTLIKRWLRFRKI
jgi:DNA-directed RNA polymerase subunit E'/Rpb7